MTPDDLLLDRLADSLAPEPATPSPSELAHLHDALAARRSPLVPLTMRGGGRPSRRHAHPGRLAFVAGAAAVIGLGTAGVRTDVLPGPLRTAAFAIGLPVSSPALVATRGDLSDLGVVLGSGRPPSIRSAAAKVRVDLRALDPEERRRVEQTASTLLAEADAEAGDPLSGAAQPDLSGPGGASASPDGTETPSDGSGGVVAGTDPTAVTPTTVEDSSGSGATASSVSTTTTTPTSDSQDQSSTSSAQSNVQVSSSPSDPATTTTTTTTTGDG